MNMLKNNYKFIFSVGVLTFALLGVGGVHAVRSYTKAEETRLKQEMAPKGAERAVERIGVFLPGFGVEAQESIDEYAKEYGKGSFQVIAYKGYTLIVPPEKADKLDSVKEQIDIQVFSQERSTPSTDLQAAQIAEIREVFEVKGSVEYDVAMSAYVDDKGFQYNFSDGELVNKQVGANAALRQKFEKAFPHFKAGVERAAVVTNEQAKTVTDQIINKLFGTDRAEYLKANVKYEDLGEARVGIIYGDREAQALVDLVTGDVIHYSKIK